MKAIGVCGSPRKGNTEWMLKKLLEILAEHGAEVELILLRKKNIKICRGCLSCEAGGKDRKGICKIRDDMNEIYPRLLEADCIIFGTPAYFELVSGLMKLFLDRTVAICPRLEGKLAAGLSVGEEGNGQAIANLKTYAVLCKMQWIGAATGLAKMPGEIANDKNVTNRLLRLADKILIAMQNSV